MAANNPVADLIMRLMRESNSRGPHGIPMTESPELTQYLNQSYNAKRGPVLNQPADARGMGQVIAPGADAFEPSTGRPVPIGQDPAFEDPAFGLRPGAPAGQEAEGLYLWGMKNGQRTRLDGPFPSADAAMLQLKRLQKQIDPRSGFTLEIAPWNPSSGA